MSNNNFAIVSSFLPMRKNDAGLGITVLQKNSNVDDWKIIQQLDRQDASWMTFDPTHHFLYVCYSLRNATGKVYGRLEAYQINSETHLLTLINEIDVEDGPAHMSVSPDGKSLLIANYFHGDFVVRQLHSDGSIGIITDKFQDQGTGPNTRQEAAHPHSIIFDKTGEFIGVTDLGNDTISILRLSNGHISRIDTLKVPVGMGPRHLIFSPDHSVLYVIGELDGHILVVDFDNKSGKIGEIIQDIVAAPDDYDGPQSGAEIEIDSNGRILYASNRGPHALMTYQIDKATGKLSLLATNTESITNPTSFTINPRGTKLYVPNNSGQGIVEFNIDQTSGIVSPNGNILELAAPNIITFI